MKKKIKVSGIEIEYELRRNSRARRLRLAVDHDGEAIATMPRFASESAMEAFIRQKSAWLIEKINFFKERAVRFPKTDRKKDYADKKEKARELIRKKLEHFNGFYNFSYKRVAIRNQKSRWGSCSRAGNLNFNYKIADLPENLIDYIIVHELCHLRELNHSKNFWRLVEKKIPDYMERRRGLRKNGLM